MKIDAPLPAPPGGATAAAAELAGAGAAGAFTFEGPHDAFAPLVLAAASGAPVDLYTNVAIAFPRSPVHLAHIAYDLHSLSGGRFMLGLGSQVRAHIEFRYGAAWERPVERMRETIEAVKAVLTSWQDDSTLDFRGRFTTHTLMPPTFRPGPNPAGIPPILLGAIGPRMTAVATGAADGLIVHPLNSPSALTRLTLPAVDRGLRSVGRDRSSFVVVAGAIVGVWEDDRRQQHVDHALRRMLAFYGSTPAYRLLLEADGFGELQPELHRFTKEGRWADMAGLIGDDMLDRYTVRGTPDEVGRGLAARYAGMVDRVALSPQGGLTAAALAQVIAAATAASTPAA